MDPTTAFYVPGNAYGLPDDQQAAETGNTKHLYAQTDVSTGYPQYPSQYIGSAATYDLGIYNYPPTTFNPPLHPQLHFTAYAPLYHVNHVNHINYINHINYTNHINQVNHTIEPVDTSQRSLYAATPGLTMISSNVGSSLPTPGSPSPILSSTPGPSPSPGPLLPPTKLSKQKQNDKDEDGDEEDEDEKNKRASRVAAAEAALESLHFVLDRNYDALYLSIKKIQALEAKEGRGGGGGGGGGEKGASSSASATTSTNTTTATQIDRKLEGLKMYRDGLGTQRGRLLADLEEAEKDVQRARMGVALGKGKQAKGKKWKKVKSHRRKEEGIIRKTLGSAYGSSDRGAEGEKGRVGTGKKGSGGGYESDAESVEIIV